MQLIKGACFLLDSERVKAQSRVHSPHSTVVATKKGKRRGDGDITVKSEWRAVHAE